MCAEVPFSAQPCPIRLGPPDLGVPRTPHPSGIWFLAQEEQRPGPGGPGKHWQALLLRPPTPPCMAPVRAMA